MLRRCFAINMSGWRRCLAIGLTLFVCVGCSEAAGYGNVCYGTNNGLSHDSKPLIERYKHLRKIYSGCEYVEGNLELVFFQESKLNFSFLQDIKEVFGYVLIVATYAKHIPLTSLRIIRGRDTKQAYNFTVNSTGAYPNNQEPKIGYSLFVANNIAPNSTSKGLKELQMPNLTEISSGNVLFLNNTALCYVNSINWASILSTGSEHIIYQESSNNYCGHCHNSCADINHINNTRRCWGHGETMCQKLNAFNCTSQCKNRCFGPDSDQCCDEECSAGCSGRGKGSCFACKNIINQDQGECQNSCPAHIIYDWTLRKNVKNPAGRFNYGHQCVKKCPPHMIEEEGSCVSDCSTSEDQPRYANPEGVCVPCGDKPCPKTCDGTGDVDWLNADNIHNFVNCTTIKGCLKIQLSTFTGDPVRNQVGLTLNDLAALENVQEITEYLLIDAVLENFTSLSFLRNLKAIQGRKLDDRSGASLVIYESSLEKLELNSLRMIRNGNIIVRNNSRLCYADSIRWEKIGSGINQIIRVIHNRNNVSCASDGKVCHPECNITEGCMGPGNDQCFDCQHYQYENKCLRHCTNYDPMSPLMAANDTHCQRCHVECQQGCDGDRDDQCWACRHEKVNTSCVLECPTNMFPNSEHICQSRNLPLIIGLTTFCSLTVIGIIIVVVMLLRRQLIKEEEKKLMLTAKLSGVVECEPLTPGHVKPDMSVLRLIKESDLRRGAIIGSGAFGTVYKGFWIPEGENLKIPVAIKVLQDGSSENKTLLEEARIMASVVHPCCIHVLAVCVTARMMLVTQLMPLGCLLDYIRKNKDSIGSKVMLNWCTQIARGMNYLEERGIIHRDLAARNVLVQSAQHVKITDFGLAKLVQEDGSFHEEGGKLPIKWLALECIRERLFSHKTDVWSYGVTVWEICTYGSRPYENINVRDLVRLLENGERLVQPSICTIDIYMLMVKCWMLDADMRPSFMELAEEFAKMARDPGRFLVIPNDQLMRLPSHTVDNRELLRNMSLSSEGPEAVVMADEYLNEISKKNNLLRLDETNEDEIEDLKKPNGKKKQVKLVPELNVAIFHSETGNTPPGDETVVDNRRSPRYSPDPCIFSYRPPSLTGGKDTPSVNSNHKPPGGDVRIPLDDTNYLQPQSAAPVNYLDLVSEEDEEEEEADETDNITQDDTNHTPSPPTTALNNPEYFEKDYSVEKPLLTAHKTQT